MCVHAFSNTDSAGSNLGADNFSKNKKNSSSVPYYYYSDVMLSYYYYKLIIINYSKIFFD